MKYLSMGIMHNEIRGKTILHPYLYRIFIVKIMNLTGVDVVIPHEWIYRLGDYSTPQMLENGTFPLYVMPMEIFESEYRTHPVYQHAIAKDCKCDRCGVQATRFIHGVLADSRKTTGLYTSWYMELRVIHLYDHYNRVNRFYLVCNDCMKTRHEEWDIVDGIIQPYTNVNLNTNGKVK